MYSNTILKLDLIVIIIQKYCFKYLKPDKNIDKIKKSKTIQFVLDQLNDIRKTKDFKTLKSIFTIEKKYKIKDLKDWLSTLYVNKLGLFSKHFKLDVEIDMTKGYKTYVNLLSKLGNNKTKVDLKKSNKKISILFNLLFCNIIVGGAPKKEPGEEPAHKKLKTFTVLPAEIEYHEHYAKLWDTLFLNHKEHHLVKEITKHLDDSDDLDDLDDDITEDTETFITRLNQRLTSTLVPFTSVHIFIVLARAWTSNGDVYIKGLVNPTTKLPLYTIKFEPVIEALWQHLQTVEASFAHEASKFAHNPSLLITRHKYCIMLTFLAKLLYADIYEQFIHKYPDANKYLTIFIGTNQYVIDSITKREDYLIPQSGTFELKSAQNFLNFEDKNILMIYKFKPNVVSVTPSQLYLPVTTRIISLMTDEEETLLVAMNYTLQINYPVPAAVETLQQTVSMTPEATDSMLRGNASLTIQQRATLRRTNTEVVNREKLLRAGVTTKLYTLSNSNDVLKIVVFQINPTNRWQSAIKRIITATSVTTEFRKKLISEEALDSVGSLGSFEFD